LRPLRKKNAEAQRVSCSLYFPFWIAYDLFSSRHDASRRLKIAPNNAMLQNG
jgi:hypothetical protein